MSKAMYWDYQAAARANYAEGRYVASWLNLFEGEEAKDEQQNRWSNRKPNTSRQKEIQRLWQQRGLLERAKANLNSCIPLVPDNCLNSRLHLVSSARLIMDLIEINKMNMANVKERIPA